MYRMADCSVVEPFFVFESRQQTGHPQCVLEVDKFTLLISKNIRMERGFPYPASPVSLASPVIRLPCDVNIWVKFPVILQVFSLHVRENTEDSFDIQIVHG
jgi:hypothetical protein